MGAIKDLIDTTGIPAMTSAVGGAVGNQIGYGLGELTGYNKALERDQLRQQQGLTDMQSKANLALMKDSYKEQQQLWDNTNMEAQIAHMKNAGLNPALMYAKGGTGGSTGGGGATVGGGQASNTAAMQQSNTSQLMAGMGMQKLQSEIDLNKASAEKLRADANTSNESRPWLVEKLKQEGKGTWIENVRKEYQDRQPGITHEGEIAVNDKYGSHVITGESLFNQEAVSDIMNTLANTEYQEASKILTDKRAQGYFQELANETARANAAGIQAAAQKLAADFNYGDLFNTKWWIQLGQAVVGDVLNGIGKFKGMGAQPLPPIRRTTTIRGRNGQSTTTEYERP